MSTNHAVTPDQRHNISLLLEAIQLHFESQNLKTRILKCQSQAIVQWKDGNGLDLLHHCILENNVIALVHLLNRGLFKPPYEPRIWPYLHLVACLGYRTFISTIIQDMKFQHEAVVLDWSVYSCAIKSKLHQQAPELQEAEKSKKLTPVDIAALFGNIQCVRLILDFWQVQNSSSEHRRKSNSTMAPTSYLTIACQVNSPNALRLLLQEHSDKKEALESAMRMGVPECIDVVLREGGSQDVKKAFQGMNLFHVLYSYRSCRTPNQYEAMVEITSVLLRHNQNVNACRPSRTFPLYSLLSHYPGGCSVDECAPYLIAALLVLVSAGADPNVDEILIEEKLRDPEQSTAFGRRPYSSAVHCLLCTLPLLKRDVEDTSSTDPIDQYVYSA
ncbi:uncharacterized protein LOC101858981 [Aplysia californica]|uniref:Uncharacterized protein LOC101858981 n=1 Tax=Aplysia californica TaxID=6500 RepID=A0ABM0JAP9_APLCA|nr:uncharacterized protein LOC101858981 [Aplysia californica]